MKKFLLGLAVTLCVAALSCVSGGGSGDAGLGPAVPIVGEWNASGDQNDGGTSTAVSEEVQQDGVTAYKVSGETTTAFQYGYANFSLTPDAATLAGLKTAKALSFKILGDGKRYTIKFKTSGINDHAYFEYHFNTVAGEALTIEVPIRAFMQPSWGQSVGRLRPENFTGLEFQTHESWRPATYEYTVWDFNLYQ